MTFGKWMNEKGYSYSDFDRPQDMADLIEEFAASPQAGSVAVSAEFNCYVDKLAEIKDLAAVWIKASELFDRQGDTANAKATLTCAEQLINILAN